MRGSFEVLQYLSRNCFRDIGGLDKLVLMTIASFFDNQNLAYPAAQTIADLAGISVRKVHGSIKFLMEKNILIRGNKFGSCFVYELNPEALKLHVVRTKLQTVQLAPIEQVARGAEEVARCAEEVARCAEQVANCATSGCTPCIQRNQEETKEETKEETNIPLGDAERGVCLVDDFIGGNDADKKLTDKQKKEADPLGKNDPGFCEFYELWPQHLDRKSAYSAYLSQVGVNTSKHEMLIARSREAINGIFSTRPKDKIPYPATWLNSLTWADPDADLKASPFNRSGGYKQPPQKAVQQRQGFVQDHKPNAPRLTEAEKLKAEEDLRRKFGELDV